ncbi:MAG: asparaginase [Planctomycetota bacterium]
MAKRKPKLCLITTGGTIGMVRDANGIARPPEDEADFHNMLAPLFEQYDLGVVSFPPRDSTDMTPADWNEIRLEIEGLREQGVEGFVVTHGTDTMAHAAAMLAFMLGPPPLPQPVVFTGAQRTPNAEDYDGADNLAAACAVAASELGEVAVVFAGRILRGCRVEKVSPDELDAFRSPESAGLGQVGGDGVVALQNDAVRRGLPADSLPWVRGIGPTEWILSVALSPGIMTYPYFPMLRGDDPFTGIILQGFGAGHLPSIGECDWVRLVKTATDLQIPVLLTSPLASGRASGSDYAVGQAAIEAGGIPMGGMVTPAAEIKFRMLIAAASFQDQPPVEFVRQQMAASYFGERGGSPQTAAPGV